MSFALTDFWAFFDFCLAQVVELFTLLDQVVVIDSPRFTLFNFMVSVIFVGLLIETINWLRGAHGSGGSRWDYIMRKDTSGYNQENLAAINQQMAYDKKSRDLDFITKYTGRK